MYKKAIVVLTALASTLTVLLTANLVYPTRSEVDAKVGQNKQSIQNIRKDLRDLGIKIDHLKDIIIERLPSH